MGLENLKSAFSNIKLFTETTEKTVKEVSSNLGTDLTIMTSQYSIQTELQAVDYINNIKSIGFSANQNSQSPTSLFTGVFNKNMTWVNNSLYGTMPILVASEIDYMSNEKVVGFSANQEHATFFALKTYANCKDLQPPPPDPQLLPPL